LRGARDLSSVARVAAVVRAHLVVAAMQGAAVELVAQALDEDLTILTPDAAFAAYGVRTLDPLR